MAGVRLEPVGDVPADRDDTTVAASLALAASCVLAAAGANRILYEGMKLTGYQSIIIGFIVLSAAFGLAPLLV